MMLTITRIPLPTTITIKNNKKQQKTQLNLSHRYIILPTSPWGMPDLSCYQNPLICFFRNVSNRRFPTFTQPHERHRSYGKASQWPYRLNLHHNSSLLNTPHIELKKTRDFIAHSNQRCSFETCVLNFVFVQHWQFITIWTRLRLPNGCLIYIYMSKNYSISKLTNVTS